MSSIEKKIHEIANVLASYKPVKFGFEGCRGVALFLLQYYRQQTKKLF